MKKKIAVFISGFGSNLNIFLQNKERFQEIYVVSSNAEAYGLQRAKEAGVPSLILDKPADWSRLHEQLKEWQIDVVFLAGFMKILPASFIKPWQGQMFNLHPSLLPAYKGLKAIERAYSDKNDIGVTIHEVNAEVDSGAIVAQRVAVPASDVQNSDLESVVARVHKVEHQMVQEWIDQLNS